MWIEVSGGYRLPQPEGCTQPVYRLMLDCWAQAPEERPTFTVLAQRIEALLASVHNWTPPVSEYIEVDNEPDADKYNKGGLMGLVRRMTGAKRLSQDAVVNAVYDNPAGDNSIAESSMATHTNDAGALYDMGDTGAGGGHSNGTLPGGFGDERKNTVDSLDDFPGFGDLSVGGVVAEAPTTDSNSDTRTYLTPMASPPPAASPTEEPQYVPQSKSVSSAATPMMLYAVPEDEPQGQELQLDRSGTGASPVAEAEGEELYLNRAVDGAAPVRETRALTAADVGARVCVEGYSCEGTLRFFGTHRLKGGLRCGVELDQPLGKNNGTVGDDTYFSCAANHGLLVVPGKVKLAEGLWCRNG